MCHMLTTLIFYNGLWNLIGFVFLMRELTHRKMKKSPKITVAISNGSTAYFGDGSFPWE